METSHWLRLKQLFHEALDLSVAERTAFLERHCGDNGPLRERLERLLAASEQVDETSAAAAGGGAATSWVGTVNGPDASGREQAGDWIGPYRLLQRIGEGGFGSVFMAEQEHPIRRRVALKIIKPGMDTREVVARFEQERQALALMDHPSIARVYDGGATDSGRPFFAMELVRGGPVTEFCDTHQLDVRERLMLFVSICEALQHAHQKGVIHRDIKPSNVLVAMLDGRPHPKVIDFGIAKALRERLTQRTLFTNFQQIVGTPQYMSPEQADGSVDIDTRSDVYSLGVVLYEMLTGAPPFDVRQLGSAAEIQRVIREQEPPKPSTRLGMLRDSSSAAALSPAESQLPSPQGAGSSAIDIARQRRTDAAALVRLLRGELDWIVMKALEKDRARRYASPGALADDLQRYLRDEAVSAGPPGRMYQLRKWCKRNKAAAIAGVTTLAALLAGLGSATYGYFIARQERDAKEAARAAEQVQRSKAEANERAALIEAGRSREISQFLQEMLASVEPRVALGQDVTLLREVLDRAAARVGSELRGQPEIEATLRLVIGGTYGQIGEFALGEQHLREALRLREGLRNEPATAEALARLAQNLFLQARYAEGAPLLREALRINQAEFGENSPAAARNMSALAAQLTNLRQLAEAEALYRKAWSIQKERTGGERADLAPTLANLAVLLEKGDRADEAEALHRAALALLKELYGDEHPEVVEELANLGQLRRSRGDLPEALALLREAVCVQRKVGGPEHPGLAYPLNLLARALSDQGDVAGAEAAYREVLELREKRLVDPKDVALAWNNLAALQCARGDLSDAEAGFQAALALRRQHLGEEDPQTIQCALNLALALRDADRLEDAAALQRTQLRLIGPEESNDALRLEMLVRQGVTLAELADREPHNAGAADEEFCDEAERTLRQALSAANSSATPDRSLTATLKMHLGWTLASRAWREREGLDLSNAHRRAIEAEVLLREALDERRGTLPADDWRLISTRGLWAWTLVAVGVTTAERGEAIACLERAVAPLEQALEELRGASVQDDASGKAAHARAVTRAASWLARLQRARDLLEPDERHAEMNETAAPGGHER